MRAAIIHYHLRAGGITRVIEQAVSALAARGITPLVLAGEPPTAGAPPAAPLRHHPMLSYAPPLDTTAERLAAFLMSTAKKALGAAPDVWHFHNHSLGKNPALTAAVAALAEKGCRILLQIHDFPEDGRPALFRRLRGLQRAGTAAETSRLLYPQAPNIHYATVNSRDASLLRRAGVAAERLHVLPNPVVLDPATDTISPRPKPAFRLTFLYPTRAIRRKNLGELLFLAAAGTDARFLVSLAPENPDELPQYRMWTALSRELALPVEFEAGSPEKSVAALLAEADAAVTTSVAEGFGLAFLEPWLMDRPALGRDLPEITSDFADSGLDLSALYRRLPVPPSWIDENAWRRRLKTAREKFLAAYGRAASNSDFVRAEAAARTAEGIDFARLDADSQRKAITAAAKSGFVRHYLEEKLPSSTHEKAALLASNKRAVRTHYSLERYGELLERAYIKTAGAPAAPGRLEGADLGRILDFFLEPERFFLIRTERES